MILIVGATGVLGREATQKLILEGHRVRALVRTPEKAADLKQLGAEVIQGDLTDPASLACACQGVTSVLSAAHGMLGRGKNRSELVDDAGHRALIDAAKAAGVKHFMYVSASEKGNERLWLILGSCMLIAVIRVVSGAS